MGEYLIEKNIPIPSGYGITDEMREVLDKMQVGDSVLFAAKEWKKARNLASRLPYKKFTFRGQENGYRCWRKS